MGCEKVTQCGHSTGKETPLKISARSGRPGDTNSNPAEELYKHPAELPLSLQQQLFPKTSRSDLELLPQQVECVRAIVGGETGQELCSP